MNVYDDDDPVVFGSPGNVFRRCPFTGKPKSGDDDSDSDSSDSEAFHVESTGIFMVSLPDSLEENADSLPHSYETAPEELVPTGSDGRRSVAADAIGAEVSVEYVDDWKAIDLGRDTDVGLYSEVQSTAETVEKDKSIEVIDDCRSHSSEAKKRRIPFDESEVSLGESSSKKLRLSEEALGLSSCARIFVDKFPVDSTNSGGGSKVSSVDNNEDSGGKCKLNGMNDREVSNGENGENGENHCILKEESTEKEVKESVKNSQSDKQSNLQEEIANAHQSSSRVLPPSLSGVKKDASGERSNTSEDHPMEVTLLEILKILAGEQDRENEFNDETLSNLSILDIVQRRGMTLPRPEWWPPEY